MRKRSIRLLPFRRRVRPNGASALIAQVRRGSRLTLPRAAKTAGSVAPQGVCSWRAHSRAPPRWVKPKPPKGVGHFSRKSHSLRQSLQKAPRNRGFFVSTALATRPLTHPPAKVDSVRSAAEPSLAPRRPAPRHHGRNYYPVRGGSGRLYAGAGWSALRRDLVSFLSEDRARCGVPVDRAPGGWDGRTRGRDASTMPARLP